MDARVVDEVHDAVVPSPVLLTEEPAELDEQLAAEHLVAMHVAHVLELRLHCGRVRRVSAGGGGREYRDISSEHLSVRPTWLHT